MIENFIKQLNKLPYDKALHAFYGSLIFIAILFASLFLSFAWAIALYIVVFVAIAKEIYDYFHKNHTSDWKDIVFTILIPTLIALYLYFKVGL